VKTRWLIGLVAVVLLAFAASVASILAGSLDATRQTVSEKQNR
jgi:hypothetical protein